MIRLLKFLRYLLDGKGLAHVMVEVVRGVFGVMRERVPECRISKIGEEFRVFEHGLADLDRGCGRGRVQHSGAAEA